MNDTIATDPEEAAHRDRVQRAIGDGYELGGLLGRGGFAEVYAATDRSLKRQVAVKVLRADLVKTPTMVARFRREAEAVAQLRHPNVIPIYSVGEGEGLAYYVMPLVEGESLGERLAREGALPIAEARRILVEVADALETAHRAGLVHRDIKPDNIMLEGEERRVLVMDFGIAKATSEHEATLTATGVVIGTPQYMSPEQASGERTVDHRTDLYSLGIVGYEMLVGEPPFSGQSLPLLLMKHLTEEAPPLAGARPNCPADLADAIARCLAKDPAARWESAAELRDAVRGTRPSRPSAPVPDAVVVAAPSDVPVSRLRRRLLLLGVVVVAAVALDLAFAHRVLVSPFIAAVALFVALAWYGAVWREGFDWRDVVGRRESGRTSSSRAESTSSGVIEFGSHQREIDALRRDRMAVIGMLEQMPQAERALLAEVVPALDGLAARGAEAARRLRSLETRVDTEDDPSMRARATTERKDALERLKGAVARARALRQAVRQANSDGYSRTAAVVQGAVEEARGG